MKLLKLYNALDITKKDKTLKEIIKELSLEHKDILRKVDISEDVINDIDNVIFKDEKTIESLYEKIISFIKDEIVRLNNKPRDNFNNVAKEISETFRYEFLSRQIDLLIKELTPVKKYFATVKEEDKELVYNYYRNKISDFLNAFNGLLEATSIRNLAPFRTIFVGITNDIAMFKNTLDELKLIKVDMKDDIYELVEKSALKRSTVIFKERKELYNPIERFEVNIPINEFQDLYLIISELINNLTDLKAIFRTYKLLTITIEDYIREHTTGIKELNKKNILLLKVADRLIEIDDVITKRMKTIINIFNSVINIDINSKDFILA